MTPADRLQQLERVAHKMSAAEGTDAEGAAWVEYTDTFVPPTVLVLLRALKKARAGLKAVEDLMAESRGVAGLHLNGDDAPWDDLRMGGKYEGWLRAFDEAIAAIGSFAATGDGKGVPRACSDAQVLDAIERVNDRTCPLCGTHIVAVDVKKHPSRDRRQQIVWTCCNGCEAENGGPFSWTDFLDETLQAAYDERDGQGGGEDKP